MVHETRSIHGNTIRLTPERWQHISQNHPEMAGFLFDILQCVQEPEEIRSGAGNELLAVKSISDGKVLVVAYRETDERDGFIITAFLTKRLQWLSKRGKLWP